MECRSSERVLTAIRAHVLPSRCIADQTQPTAPQPEMAAANPEPVVDVFFDYNSADAYLPTYLLFSSVVI